ncbi:cytochrome P450 [Trametes maxima]|nr:cytochrome P450 [Trametes maxima]
MPPTVNSSFEHWVTLVLALLLLGAALFFSRRSRAKFPPGPEGLPILGCVHKLPTTFQERTLLEWSREYGDFMYLKLFRTPTIVLSSIEAARDLLDKRSAKYSDRPQMVMLTELLDVKSALPTIPYGPRMRKHRKWMYDAVGNKEKLLAYRSLRRQALRAFLRNLASDPGQFLHHIHLYLGGMMLEVTYGRPVTSMDDPLFQLAEKGLESANTSGSPGSRLVDFFPILKFLPSWFPGAGFKRRAIAIRKHVHAWRDAGIDDVMSSMAAGQAKPSIFTTVLEQYGLSPSPEELDEIKGLSFDAYGAGVETSLATLTNFFLYMARNPHVLRKAQEEMDEVVGRDRLPDYGDRPSLPYLDAILEEVYRLQPAVPMGIPHCVTVDDEYRGCQIPAGSMVIGNIWAMTRDTRYYPDPEAFLPERHMPSEKQERPTLPPSSFVFGFGRRICPGQALADENLWFSIANIVALFDIGKALGEAGEEITPPAASVSGITNQPAPFVCKITPRSDKILFMLDLLEE